MKTEDIIKWVLDRWAVYLVYRYLSQSDLFGGLTQPALPAPQPVVSTPPAQIAAPESQKVSVTTKSLLDYVKPKQPADWDGKLTISQWNWYVSKMTGTIQQTDLSFGEDVPDPVSVDDYMARRVRAGISGLGKYPARLQPVGCTAPRFGLGDVRRYAGMV